MWLRINGHTYPEGCRLRQKKIEPRYGFQIHTVAGTDVIKMDPFAQEMELPSDLLKAPAFNASVVTACDDAYRAEAFAWSDQQWIEHREEQRRLGQTLLQPMAIYEVHLASWRRTEQGELLSYRELAQPLVEHVKAGA